VAGPLQDLLVVVPRYNWEIEKQVSDLCFDVDMQIGRVVCPLLMTEDEIKNSPMRASALLAVVAREGVSL